MAASSRPDETVVASVCPDRPEVSAPVCDGRRANAESDVWRGAGENCFPRSTVEESLGRAGDGRNLSAAIYAGCAGELRRAAHGQSAGEFKLYPVRTVTRFVRPPVRTQDRHYIANVFGKGEAHAALRNYFSRRFGRRGEFHEPHKSRRRGAPPSEVR